MRWWCKDRRCLSSCLFSPCISQFSCFYDYQRRKWRRNTIHITGSFFSGEQKYKRIYLLLAVFLPPVLSWRRNENSKYSFFPLAIKNFMQKCTCFISRYYIGYLMLYGCTRKMLRVYFAELDHIASLYLYYFWAFVLSCIFFIAVLHLNAINFYVCCDCDCEGWRNILFDCKTLFYFMKVN